MKLFIKNVEGLVLPKRANTLDAGHDVVATAEPLVSGVLFGVEKAGVYSLMAEARDEKWQRQWSRIDYIEYATNLYWTPESENSKTWHLEIFPRSSISKYQLVLANSVGTIDTGYTNMVMARFKYLFQPEDLTVKNSNICGVINSDKIYKKGDKILQIKPRLNEDIEFEIVSKLPETDGRKMGGFGSTGN